MSNFPLGVPEIHGQSRGVFRPRGFWRLAAKGEKVSQCHYCFPISGTTCCATRLNFASNLVLLVVNCDLCQVFELLEELTKKGVLMHESLALARNHNFNLTCQIKTFSWKLGWVQNVLLFDDAINLFRQPALHIFRLFHLKVFTSS